MAHCAIDINSEPPPALDMEKIAEGERSLTGGDLLTTARAQTLLMRGRARKTRDALHFPTCCVGGRHAHLFSDRAGTARERSLLREMEIGELLELRYHITDRAPFFRWRFDHRPHRKIVKACCEYATDFVKG